MRMNPMDSLTEADLPVVCFVAVPDNSTHAYTCNSIPIVTRSAHLGWIPIPDPPRKYREPVLPQDAGKEVEVRDRDNEKWMLDVLTGYNSSKVYCWQTQNNECAQCRIAEDT